MRTSSRRRLVAPVIALALLAAACGASGSSAQSPDGAEASGQPTEFTAPTLSGADFDSASLAGKDAVLWFWAPWCTICRGEAPDVVAAAETMDGSVEVIGVGGRGARSEMDDFVADTGTGGLTHVVDESGTIWSSYGVFAQPAYAFSDDSGSVEVVAGALGERALVERMTELASS